MRAEVNTLVGIFFIGGFSALMGALIIVAFKTLPAGIPPTGF